MAASTAHMAMATMSAPGGARGGFMGLWQSLSRIRVQLVLGFLAAFAGMAAFGALSYTNFMRMEHKLVFLSQADGMLNTVLEVRRYEKNYFLYHHEADFRQALDYLDQFERMWAGQRGHIAGSVGPAGAARLMSLANQYRQSFIGVHERLAGGADETQVAAQVDALRAAGKALIERSEALAEAERQGVSDLLREYRPLLVGFLVLLAALGALVSYSLYVRLVRPLATIEEATLAVGEGGYHRIQGPSPNNEIGSLVRAFNRMVIQLRHNNEQMVQTEKLTSLGTLTSGVAHELNNPLSNISTSCQILLEEVGQEVEPYHRELLAAVDEQVSKARDIVGSLLEFARQRKFELRPLDLRGVVEEALRLLRGQVPAEVEVVVDVPEGIVMDMDKAHMVQALLNLLMNAIQAMPDGGQVTVLARGDAYDERVNIEVIDTGQGIPLEALPRIFDPFFTTKPVGRGTGLGLSITYGIVERHRGHISASSRPGEGARFVMTLPLRAEEG